MQQVSKTIVTKQSSLAKSALVAVQTNHFSEQATHKPQLSMANEESKHRVDLPLYDLRPRFVNNWVAPNSTVGK